ncbi:30S ribosomal protein S5 [bacterium]|nr:30S ribosomal protein S5 [bacterium]NBX98368.1 30S ribosomal protein S5 [bacterium]NDC93728.1 30S ribosomal protein S5 [bacterium]NDD82869.1 30S ribosomal protein S5 [bacterium]NDG28664.1 30S ribosomal protein S5 [bacterium]
MAREPRNQTPQEPSPFDERVMHVDRVARVVKGGRRFRFRALVVVGDRKHRVGIGIAKGADVTAAVSKATEVAKKNMITVPVLDGTLPHEASAKVGGAHILIKPARAGTGLIAGGVVRTILEVGGVSNILSKSLGSSNKINVSYATLDAIRAMKPKNNWVTTKNAADAKKAASTAKKAEK